MVSKLLKHNNINSEYKGIDFFYSPDMKEDISLHDELALNIVSETTVDCFLGMNPDFNKVIEANAKKSNLENIAILAAHGTEKNGKWVYFINDKTKSMQSWINSVDGKYKTIILYSCNPGRNEIYSKKTPILAPNETFSHRLLNQGKVQIELVMPGTGHVDSYMLEEELRRLEE